MIQGLGWESGGLASIAPSATDLQGDAGQVRIALCLSFPPPHGENTTYLCSSGLRAGLEGTGIMRRALGLPQVIQTMVTVRAGAGGHLQRPAAPLSSPCLRPWEGGGGLRTKRGLAWVDFCTCNSVSCKTLQGQKFGQPKLVSKAAAVPALQEERSIS